MRQRYVLGNVMWEEMIRGSDEEVPEGQCGMARPELNLHRKG